ncbi:MAG: DUF2064 domain-containing protein [Cyclobacteriaceae bacterium]
MDTSSQNNTALVLFARSAEDELRHKKLCENKGINKYLLQSLYNRSVELAEQADLPLFHYDENAQSGSNFGERLTYCISNVLAEGYQKVIVIGSDCPDISLTDIRKAEYMLGDSSMVVGPDQRGGTFLLGLRAEIFTTEIFTSLDWQQETLVLSISKLAFAKGWEIAYLRKKFDLNHTYDLKKYRHVSGFLIKIFCVLLAQRPNFHFTDYQYSAHFYHTLLSRRGPPSAS